MKFKFLAIAIMILLVSVSFGIANSINQKSADKELDLLYGDVIFPIQASKDTFSSFNVYYAVPPIYCYQSPILFELKNDTTAKIISYRIINDTYSPNQIIKFTIAPMKKDENATIHFDFWVLVNNNDYGDIPSYVKKPMKYQLPIETKTWLQPTRAIQSNNFRIKLKALCLQRFNGNLIKIAENVANFTGSMEGDWSGLQDARSTLIRGNGVCTGRANLGTALFRAVGIPARDIAVMPTWSKELLFDMHYISQYYCPNYGWVFVETTLGKTPYEQKNNIVMRVHYPVDENKAGNYGGVELWFWADNVKICFPYHGIGPGNGRRAWIENILTTNQQMANSAFNITKSVYGLHTRYIGMNFTGYDLGHFNNATKAQKDAITCFIQSNIDGYIENITLAYDEYNKINYPQYSLYLQMKSM